MINCRVYIRATNEYLDDGMFVEIKLPTVPRVGDVLYYRQYEEELERLIKNKYKDDFEDLMCEYSHCLNNYRKTAEDFSISDFIWVHDIAFEADADYVCITMTNNRGDMYHKDGQEVYNNTHNMTYERKYRRQEKFA